MDKALSKLDEKTRDLFNEMSPAPVKIGELDCYLIEGKQSDGYGHYGNASFNYDDDADRVTEITKDSLDGAIQDLDEWLKFYKVNFVYSSEYH
jgi:hypothetical protein